MTKRSRFTKVLEEHLQRKKQLYSRGNVTKDIHCFVSGIARVNELHVTGYAAHRHNESGRHTNFLQPCKRVFIIVMVLSDSLSVLVL